MRYEIGTVGNKIIDCIGDGKQNIINEGGTWSGKSFNSMLVAILLAEVNPGLSVRVCAYTTVLLKDSVRRDFFDIMGTNTDDEKYNGTDHIFTFPNGAFIKFIAFDTADKAKASKYDVTVLDEGNNFKWGAASNLLDRTRWLFMVSHNPVRPYWVHRHLLDRKETAYIHSTYKDNIKNVPERTIKTLEDKKKTDPNGYRIMTLGLMGKVEGLIWPNHKFIDEDKIPEGGYVIYGIDWGQVHPCAVVKVWWFEREKTIYAKEIFAGSYMTWEIFMQKMEKAGINKTDELFCDDARPEYISQLQREGYNAHKARKPSPMNKRLEQMAGYTIYICNNSKAMQGEIQGYSWVKDSDNNITDKVDKCDDDRMDAMSYALWGKTHLRLAKGVKSPI